MENDPLLFRNLKAMNLFGMWPPNDPKYAKIYKVYSKLVHTWFITFVTTQLIEINYIYNDFKQLTANMAVSLLYSVVVAKVYIIIYKNDAANLVTKIRETEHTILQSNNDVTVKNIVQDYILQNWGVTWKFWILVFCTIAQFFVRPGIEYVLFPPEEILFLNGTGTGKFKLPLIFSSWFPFDRYDGYHYFVANGLQMISGTIGASYIAIWDTFIVALMIFATGQFKVLQCLLRNIYPTNGEMSDEGIDEISVNKRFVECVKHHNMIIKFVEDLDALISSVMFLDFIVCSLMLCAIGLWAILEGANIHLVFPMQYLMALLIELFMYSWYANEIILESSNVSNAAWECRWYDCGNNVKKGLILVIMRAQKPCILTAGGFYTMSLQTFLQILQATYSYVALLRQAQNL